MASNALTTSTSPKFALFRDVGMSRHGAPKSWVLALLLIPHLTPPSAGLHHAFWGRLPFSKCARKKEKDLDRERGKGGLERSCVLAMQG